MCEFKRPFDGTKNVEVENKILNAQLARINKRYSNELWKLCKAMIEKKPEERFSMREILSFPVITDNAQK